MILDAILLAFTEIALIEQRNVAILPEMRIPQGDEVQRVRVEWHCRLRYY